MYDGMHTSRTQRFPALGMSQPRVATMTMGGMTAGDSTAIKKFVEPFSWSQKKLDKLSDRAVSPASKVQRLNRRGSCISQLRRYLEDNGMHLAMHGREQFFNQLTIDARFPDLGGHRVSCKLFSKGSLHATGAKSPLDAVCCFTEICRMVNDLQSTNLRLESIRAYMINVSFAFGHAVRLRPLREAMMASDDEAFEECRLNEEGFPGIVCKLRYGSSPASAFLYTTGSVMITSNSPENILKAFDFIGGVVSANMDVIFRPEPRPVGRMERLKDTVFAVREGFCVQTYMLINPFG